MITIKLKADAANNLPETVPDRTPDQVTASVIDASRPWFVQASHGMFSGFFALKRGPVTVQTTATPCSRAWLTEIGDQADKFIHDHEPSLVPGQHNAVIYYFGTVAACLAHTQDAPNGAAGWGDLPAQSNRVWLNGFSDLREAVHELGHNLGLQHSGSQTCKDTHGAPVPLSGDCKTDEYGDAFSAMGDALSDGYAPNQLAQLGWNQGRVATVTASSATTGVTLTAAELDTPGSTQAVRLIDGGTTLWLEYRRPATQTSHGFPFETIITDGLLVRREQAAPDGSNRAYLLSMNQTEFPDIFHTIKHPNMVQGQTWADPLGTMQITLDNTDQSTAHLTIRPTVKVPDILFYRGSDGQAATGTVNTAGAFTNLQTFGLSSAWTHVVPAGGNRFLFYRAGDGTAVTGAVSESGGFTSLQGVGGFLPGWTSIVSFDGRLLFYRASDGQAATGIVNTAGAFTNLQTFSLSPGWTHVAYAGGNRFLFYRAGDGTAVTGAVSESGGFTSLQGVGGFLPGWTHIARTDVVRPPRS